MSGKYKDRSYSDLAKIFINSQVETFTVENVIGYCLAVQPVERREWKMKVIEIVTNVINEMVISGNIEIREGQIRRLSIIELSDYIL